MQWCAVNVSVIGGVFQQAETEIVRSRDGEVEKPWFFSKLNLLLPFKKVYLATFSMGRYIKKERGSREIQRVFLFIKL